MDTNKVDVLVVRDMADSVADAVRLLELPEFCALLDTGEFSFPACTVVSRLMSDYVMLVGWADAVAELIADIRQARGALSQNATFPADIALARTALDRAIARISVCNCPGYGKWWQEAHAPNCPERAALARVGGAA